MSESILLFMYHTIQYSSCVISFGVDMIVGTLKTPSWQCFFFFPFILPQVVEKNEM